MSFSLFQIHAQFPCSFEFTEKFLVTLADHAYFSNFGTFLCDSEYERNLLGVKENTVSLWSFLNRPEVLSKYLNCLYEPNGKVIWPSVAPVSLVILRALRTMNKIDSKKGIFCNFLYLNTLRFFDKFSSNLFKLFIQDFWHFLLNISTTFYIKLFSFSFIIQFFPYPNI